GPIAFQVPRLEELGLPTKQNKPTIKEPLRVAINNDEEEDQLKRKSQNEGEELVSDDETSNGDDTDKVRRNR
ncbi:hypothetical protein HHI36_001521, partial [Cryptolaemus montrouzieri]